MKEFRIPDPRTNDRIRVPEVRLVGPGGEQVGVVPIAMALRLAQEADLDLVEVAPNSKPPVAKIMDYGKFKYEAAQKAKEARRNQANTVLKEVRFRLKIDAHDYETKRKRAEGFLAAGDKVKAMILFRGREQSRPELGVRLLQRFAEDIADFGVVESRPTQDGRNMTMVVSPIKNKSDVKGEQNAKKAAAKAAARADRAVTPREEAPAPMGAAASSAPESSPVSAPAASRTRSADTAATPATSPASAAPASTSAAPASTSASPRTKAPAPAATPKAPAPAATPATSAPVATPATSAPASAAASEPVDSAPTTAAKPAAAKPAAAKPAAAPKATPAAPRAAASKAPTPKPAAASDAPATPRPTPGRPGPGPRRG